MTKITLTDRSEEIFKLLPKNYAEIILNSIIAKSIDNGSLIEESKIFLNNNSIITLLENLDIKNNNCSKQKIIKQKQKKESDPEEKELNDDELSEKEGLDLFEV